MAEKLFYSMGEVAEMFDVNPSLLRYWEEQFPMLKPRRNKKGNRHYTPEDIEVLKSIYHLVKERGMRIEGARKALREERKAGKVVGYSELLERLQHIRTLLMEVREELHDDGAEMLDEEPSSPERDLLPAIDKQGKVVAVIPDEPTAPSEKPKVRRPRRKRNGEEKELFAFYEQSLF